MRQYPFGWSSHKFQYAWMVNKAFIPLADGEESESERQHCMGNELLDFLPYEQSVWWSLELQKSVLWIKQKKCIRLGSSCSGILIGWLSI